MGKLLLIGGLLILIAAGLGLLWRHSQRSEFERRVAALRARGEPTSPADLAQPAIPDSQNAAAGLRVLVSDVVSDARRPDPDLAHSGALTRKDRARLWKAAETFKPFLKRVREAVARPGWSAPRDRTWNVFLVLGRAQEILFARVAGDPEPSGRTKRAAEDAQLALALARNPRGTSVLSVLWRYNWAGAACNLCDAAARRPGFDAALFRRLVEPALRQSVPPRGPPLRAFEELRALTIDAAEHPPSIWLHLPSNPFRILHRFRLRFRIARDALRALDDYERILPLCDETPERAAAIARTLGSRHEWRHASATAVFEGMFQKYAKAIARVRATRVALALLEARQETGHWPAALDALASRFPHGLPKDPFTNAPFAYERTPKGVRLTCKSKIFSSLSHARTLEIEFPVRPPGSEISAPHAPDQTRTAPPRREIARSQKRGR